MRVETPVPLPGDEHPITSRRRRPPLRPWSRGRNSGGGRRASRCRRGSRRSARRRSSPRASRRERRDRGRASPDPGGTARRERPGSIRWRQLLQQLLGRRPVRLRATRAAASSFSIRRRARICARACTSHVPAGVLRTRSRRRFGEVRVGLDTATRDSSASPGLFLQEETNRRRRPIEQSRSCAAPRVTQIRARAVTGRRSSSRNDSPPRGSSEVSRSGRGRSEQEQGLRIVAIETSALAGGTCS